MTMQSVMNQPTTPPPSANRQIISRLQEVLRAEIAQIIGSSGEYALLDFPNYSNIGDSAIFVGQTILLNATFGREPSLVTQNRQKDIEQIAEQKWDGPLILTGGGNFGDLYPKHQHFREAVIRRFPDRQIIQFPQSIHFRDKANLESTARAIETHPNFTLMVRDEASLALAKDHFDCDVRLAPDMAFMIGSVDQPVAVDQKVLCLIRQDQETVFENTGALARLPQPNMVVDWPKEPRRRTMVHRLPTGVRRRLPRALQSQRPETPAAYEWLARRRVRLGLSILSRGEIVITDRLHAHILSILLGKPHVALDNSYGKIGSFINAWTQGGAFVQAAGIDEAVEKALLMLGREHAR